MTEFARQYLKVWLRGRILLTALGVFIVQAVALTMPAFLLSVLSVLLGLNLVYSIALRFRSPQIADTHIYAAFLIDILGVAVIVRYTNGVAGGFAAAYILIAFNSILLLGRTGLVRVVGMILAAFVAQVALELLGLGTEGVRLPPGLAALGQILLLATLFYTSYLVSQTNTTVIARWRGESQIAEMGRATAEQEQQRWALINKVALRVQESTTPQQVLQSVGEELERVGLHCLVLEWATPGECLRISHSSMNRAPGEAVSPSPGFDPASFRLYPADHPRLQGAIAARAPILIRDVERAAELRAAGNPRPLPGTALQEVDAEMTLYAPMTSQNRVCGLLVAWGRSLNENDLAPLAALAQQTASALDKARLLTVQNKRAAQLELVSSIATQISAAIQTDEIIHSLVRAIGERFGYPVVSIVVVDDARNDLFVPVTYSTIGELNDAPTHQPLDRGILGYVARTGKTYLARETRGDPYYYSPNPENDPIRSELVIPLRAQDSVIGVLDVESAQPDAFDASDVTALTLLADQISAALEKSRLFESEARRAAQLDTIRVLALKLTAERDLDTLLRSIVSSVVELVRAQGAALYIADDARGDLVVRISYQLPHSYVGRRIRPGEGLAGRVAQRGEPMVIANYGTWEHRAGQYDGETFARVLSVPLKWQERVLGVINLHRDGDHPLFDQEEQRLATLFAAQAVIAIENARLFQETQQRLVQVRTLHAAAQAVNADLQLEAVLEQVVDQFIAALNVDSCTISEYDGARQQIVTLLDRDPLPEVHAPPGSRFAMSRTELELMTHSEGKAHAFRRDDPNLNEDLRTLLARFRWRAVVIAPLIVKGEILGYVELGERKAERTFDEGEVQLAESLANQAAIAIQNARLYDDARKRLEETETLYGFARALGATLDIQVLGKRALEAAGRLTNFDLGEVSLYRESDGALVPLVITGVMNPDMEAAVLPRGVGISGWVVEHGHAVRVGDVTRDPRYFAMSPNILSEICVPLRIGARVIGVLNLEAKAPDAFDAHIEQLLTAFANQLAITIENARLYEQTKRDAEVKAALLRELSHRVKNNLAAITSLLYMALDEPPETREKILNETLGRVQSMSLAHALLARSGEARVNLLELGRQVLQDTVRQLAKPGLLVDTECGGEDVQVAVRQTTTLALVLNELATNALRHGLNGTGANRLRLRLEISRQGQEVWLALNDDGIGIPHAFELSSDAGLGLNLVRTLVEKDLHGRFVLERRGPWTCADIRFRLEEDVV